MWTVVAILPIVIATLSPQPEWQRAWISWWAPAGVIDSWFDIGQNLVLYVPLGVMLAARGLPVARAVLPALLLSLATEALQTAVPGRSAAGRDVVVNVVGALVGWSLWTSAAGILVRSAIDEVNRLISSAVRAEGRRASILSVAWAVAVSVVFGSTAVLLTPAPLPAELSIASPYLDTRPGPVRIGGNGRADGAFNGLIDEVRLYNRARAAGEIRDDMQRPIGSRANEGLVAGFSFDQTHGTLVPDDSGHGQAAVVAGATWSADGRFGGALRFDGRGSPVTIPHRPALDFRDGMTLEAWVRPSAEGGGEPAIISREGSLYYLDESSSLGRGRVAAGGRFGAMPRYARLVEPIRADEWTHLASTFDGASIRLYVNGSLATEEVHWSRHRPEVVRLNGGALVPGDVSDPVTLERALRNRSALALRIQCGTPSGAIAPVFLIAGLHNTPVIAIDAVGTSALISHWTWARWLGLPSPPVRVADAFTGCVDGQRAEYQIINRLQNPTVDRDGQRLRTDAPGIASGWMFAFHTELLPGWLQSTMTVLWLVAAVSPLGYWLRQGLASAFAVSITVVVCATLPAMLNIRPVSAREMVALGVGVGVGGFYRRFRTRTL